jgi:phosphonate transport system ATP-binding protein
MCQPVPIHESPALLRLERGRVIYPTGHEALKPVSLALHGGEICALLGPSGAGKSTLLRALNGLVPLTEGRLHAADVGEVIDKASLRAHRRRTGMVFQSHQLIGRLTALDNALTGRLAYHSTWRAMRRLPEADQRVALASLDRVGLASMALRRVDSLSGGQQQRVGIARALAQQPRILLADEPVASLDPATASRVLGLIREICQSGGITAFVSLHQTDLALAFADRIVGIAAGRIVFDDAPARLGPDALAAIYGGSAPPETPAGEPADDPLPLSQPVAA